MNSKHMSIVLLVMGLAACVPAQYPGTAPKIPSEPPPPATRDILSAPYLTPLEQEVISEVNTLRANPAAYADRVLVPMKKYYKGLLVQLPGEATPTQTSEGISALNSCIAVLKGAKPVPPLTPAKGLTLAARDHVRDQGRTGRTGHTGSDGSDTGKRINRYGKWDLSAGENIDYGNRKAEVIVAALLIDDNTPSRLHRKNLLNASFNFVGLSVGPHPTYGSMCVIDFAGAYVSQP